MTARKYKDGTRRALLKFASRKEGITPREAAARLGKPTSACQQGLYQLTKLGLLFSAGPPMHKRWFGTQAEAEAYDRAISPSIATRRTAKPPTVTLRPPRPQEQPNVAPTITSSTKITRAPTPPPRFASSDPPRVIDSSECRPWALAATGE